MILIASAAYVNAEFQIEFGRLPPALLPVGNRRLFEHQVDALQRQFPLEPIVLSLPASYPLPAKDAMMLARANVRVVGNDERLSLADSIAAALDQADGLAEGVVRLLHGDTWIGCFPEDADVIALVDATSDYGWEPDDIEGALASLDTGAGARPVWCGWFSFSRPSRLRAELTHSGGSFTAAVRRYDAAQPMLRRRASDWRDFGHVNTYYLSRADMTTERAFNALTVADGRVRKTGTPAAKIQGESSWFLQLPSALRAYAPQLLDHGIAPDGAPFYELEYLPLPPLNELFVHGRNPVAWWDRVFNRCAEFMSSCHGHPITAAESQAAALDFLSLTDRKTRLRLDAFIRESGSSSGQPAGHPGLDTPSRINGAAVPSLRVIADDCLARLALGAGGTPAHGVMHGDFCLSNILFDSRTDRIKVVDPRGMNAEGLPTVIGDLRYDLAKLTHSVLGLYDHIVAGAFDLERSVSAQECVFDLRLHVDERTEAIQALFSRQRFVAGLRPADVMPLVVLLFLGMLPLHADKPTRQWALLANALRLYALHVGAQPPPSRHVVADELAGVAAS